MSPAWQQLLSAHYEDPYHRGSCEQATHVGNASCQASGCQLELELAIDRNGKLQQMWFDGTGCATCEPLASLLAEYCEGRELSELQALEWSTFCRELQFPLVELQRSSPCCQLPLDALRAALQYGTQAATEDGPEGLRFDGPSLGEEC